MEEEEEEEEEEGEGVAQPRKLDPETVTPRHLAAAAPEASAYSYTSSPAQTRRLVFAAQDTSSGYYDYYYDSRVFPIEQ